MSPALARRRKARNRRPPAITPNWPLPVSRTTSEWIRPKRLYALGKRNDAVFTIYTAHIVFALHEFGERDHDDVSHGDLLQSPVRDHRAGRELACAADAEVKGEERSDP